MGRYTGPTERLSRRAGVELELKGERRMARKSGLDRRAHPPGEHGRSLRAAQVDLRASSWPPSRPPSATTACASGQFRRYVREAQRATARRTGERLLQLLELRLDNVLTRLGFAATRAQARQFVVHGHVEVNGRRCDIPSRRLAAGDVVAIRSREPGPAGGRAGDGADRARRALAAGRHGRARRARAARAGPRRDPGPVEEQLDRRVLQPRVRPPMFAPLPFALHATTGCPPHAELALSLAWTFEDLDAAALDARAGRGSPSSCPGPRAPTRSTS